MPTASTQSTAAGKLPRHKVVRILFTTVAAIALGVFENLANPFGLDTDTDRLSANIFNTITSPLYGRRSSVKLEGEHHESRLGQSNIIVLLIDNDYLDHIKKKWPLEPRRYRLILQKLVDAGASAIFVDIFFVKNPPEREQSIANLYRQSGCLARASACSTVSDDWMCDSDEKQNPPCPEPVPNAGTAIIFASTLQEPIPEAGGETPAESALAQMRSEENFYNLRETALDEMVYDTGAWATYKAWCRRDAKCDSSSLDEFPQESMFLHWGYAPNHMMTDTSDFGASECVPQASTLIGRMGQSVNIFRWNMIRGFHDSRIAPCPYSSQVNLRLFDDLSAGELRQLFEDKIVLLGASLDYYPDYQLSPVHGYVPGVFWHAMAIDNLIEFSDRFVKEAPESVRKYLEAAGLTAIFLLQALLTWTILRREVREKPGKMAILRLDLLHGLLIICVISTSVLWMVGFERWSPENWIGFAMLMFLIDVKPITAVPRFCWRIFPTARISRRPFRFASNVVLAIICISLMLLAAYCIFILPHTLLLAREPDDMTIIYTFIIAYLAIILICAWKIAMGRLI